ncbi:MAG TPA: phosphoribosyltransferase family protein [Kofleriaceae bacterium]|jgi:ComF family protein|nr:phosphoribosyltransferase family protein [Kofleriaceae bacterium]
MLRWLYRPQCAACAKPSLDGAPLCADCAVSLVPLTAQPEARAPLQRVASPWAFGGALASAIRRLKFAGATHIARTIAPLWAPLLEAAVIEHDAIVVPVPLHWRRRLRRGFDQTWLLAAHACALAKLPPPVAALRRIRYDAPQSTLAAAERAANIEGAFRARADVTGRAIILVDDVTTTGSTLVTAARALGDAGASLVVGITVARAE